MNKYIVLVCGLDIRDQNRMNLTEQRSTLAAIRDDLDATPVEDKGSYLVTTPHEPGRVVDLVLGALRARRPDLHLPGAAVSSPHAVERALANLRQMLVLKYGRAFDASDSSIKAGDDEVWRAGLALPLYPSELPAASTAFHCTKNARIFGWTHDAVLIAKREARDVHWGTTVRRPCMAIHQA